MRRAVVLLALAPLGCSLLLDDDFTGGAGKPASDGGQATDAFVATDALVTDETSTTKDAESDTSGPLSYAATITQDAPVSWWRFEDTSTSILVDELGAHNISVSNPSIIKVGEPGAVGKSIHLDGNGELALSGTFDLSAGKTFTIEGWIRNTDSSDFYRRIFSKITIGPDGPIDGTYLWVNGGRDATGFERWNAKTVTDPIYWHLPSRDTFTHLVVVVSGARSVMYANAALVASGDKDGPPPASDPLAPVLLGAQFLGWLDEMAFYDKPLSAERVKAHFDAATANR